MSDAISHQVVIVGGGTAGVAVAAHLKKFDESGTLDVAVLEPKDVHYYQPGWTLVGAGEMKPKSTWRSMKEVIPEGVTWIHDAVQSFDPDNNSLTTRSGNQISYEYLVVAAGIEIAWDSIPGLQEALQRNMGVVSIYDYDLAPQVWEAIKGFGGGTAIFTQPKPPFKCPGAAQKIAYLADDAWRKRNVRGKIKQMFFSAAPGIFPVKRYAKTLNEVLKRKDIETHFQHHLVAIDIDKKEATLEHVTTGDRQVHAFDFLHVTPPMRPPAFLKESPLADEGGWMNVDKHTLRHLKYPNVYGLGDCASTPNSKTAAAARSQTYVAVSNLLTAIGGGEGIAAYDGYASCPLTTGYGKLVLAEFDYNLQPKETFPIDQSKERRSMYYFKKYFLPWYYWNVLLKGGDAQVWPLG
ncbi:MAG: FAD-dependent oxidoreductase [Methylohalobius sp. ZOD2]